MSKRHNKDIIITKADKGGATVIWDVSDYTKEAYNQLKETIFFENLNYDPTNDFTEMVTITINKLNTNGRHFLHCKTANVQKCYLLPKIHKPSNPGKPIISNITCHTSNISAFITYTKARS